MKNWPTVVLLSFILLWNCTKEPVLDPIIIVDPVPEKKFTVSAFADKGVVLDPSGFYNGVANGKSMTFSFNAKDGKTITSIKVNDNMANTYPNKNYVLFKDSITLYIYENTTLMVESVLNDSLDVSNSKWYLQTSDLGVLQSDSDTIWSLGIPEARMYTDYITFELHGPSYMIDKDGKVTGGPYVWSLNQGILEFGDLKYKVHYVDKNTLVLYFFFPSGHIARDVYAHTPLDPKLRLSK